MNKVLFLQPSLLHYRVDFYGLLQKKLDCEIHVVHAGRKVAFDLPENVYSHFIPEIRVFGFKWLSLKSANLKMKDFDKVILPLDVSWINSLLSRFSRELKGKLFFWGIGVGNNKLTTKARMRLREGYPTVLYNYSALKRFIDFSNDRENLFVCSNTVDVDYTGISFDFSKRKNVLFVGAINARKKLEEAILAFKFALPFLDESTVFNIVGDGSAKKKIELYVAKLKLENKVFLHGEITSHSALSRFYNSSFCNLSPGQCGLSALQSIANGVPFITNSDAITGGEISAIIPRLTGSLTSQNITSVTAEIIYFNNLNEKDSKEVFESCQLHYRQSFSMQNMVDSFLNALTRK